MNNQQGHYKGNQYKNSQVRAHCGYSSHHELQDLQYQTKIFSSQDVPEYFNLLKRLQLSIPNTPEIKKKRQQNSNIEVQFKIYNKIWVSHLYEQSFEDKIKSIIQILRAYLQLIKEYGLFSITVNHIKMNIYKQQAIWIHQSFHQNYCSHPLPHNQRNEHHITSQFISLILNTFQTNIFKHRQINTLADLLEHLQFIDKRNIIHKKCNFMAKDKKRASTIRLGSPDQKNRQKSDNFFFLSQGNVSQIVASNIIKEDKDKHLTKSSHMDIFESKRLKSKLSVGESTYLSTQQVAKKNKSYIQLSSIFNKITKQSTNVFSGYGYDKEIKRSEYMTRDNDFSKLLDNNAESNNKMFGGFEIQSSSNINQEQNILERDFNNLLLSQIHEDEENDMKGNHHIETQLIQEFYNILN